MKNYILLLLSMTFLLSACGEDDKNEIEEVEEEKELVEVEIETPDWDETTHSNDVEPDYETVFPDDQILSINITISDENWSAMQSDLDENLGSSSGMGADIDFTPVWVPCSFEYEGTEWYQVGIRYKGNSTLRDAYNSGTDKFSFKLDFDEFEDTYPDIKNQRFYGFKQLNLGNNYSDNSFMRDKVAADLFREFGVAAARTSFCAVYLNNGGGSEFLGFYTLVEEVDDTLAESQFENRDGDLYKPDGDAASFASGTYNEDEMDLKTGDGDYSDVLALYNLMHDGNRISDPAQWQSDLEDIFDVDNYLRYLAANNTIQNWDTYGLMTHNYFLYNNDGKLTWIPWDNNEAFQEGKMGGAMSLSMSEIGSEWPLIDYVMDIESYQAQYKIYLDEFINGVFEPSAAQARYARHQALLEGFADQESGGPSSGVTGLNTHVVSRYSTVSSYIE